MLLIHALGISKKYLHREILNIKELKIYDTDRIGIVGSNGVGKTTLMKILLGKLEPEKGRVDIQCNISYIPQLEKGDIQQSNGEMKSKLKINDLDDKYMSGGERTRIKIAKSLSSNPHIIFADEPTASLDYEGIEFLKQSLNRFSGALLLISHDREFLDSLCNKIIEIEDRSIKIYNGNYSHYVRQKEEYIENETEKRKKYNKKRKKLDDFIKSLHEENEKLMKKSKRHFRIKSHSKKNPQGIITRRHRKIKSLEKRFRREEFGEEIVKKENIDMSFNGLKSNTRIQVIGNSIFKSFKDKVIFKDANFQIRNGSKVGMLGANGSGKTTLLNMILNKEPGIEYQNNLKIVYFSQTFDELQEDNTILENITRGNELLNQRARDILGSLLIKEEDVFKKVKMLSGGEKVKILFAKVLLEEMDILILDEPTNFLDIPSLEVLEKALKAYDGTVIFVSHDKKFLSNIATEILEIKDNKLIQYPGTFDEYLYHKKLSKSKSKKEIREKIMVLENRCTIIISKICYEKDDIQKEILNKQYFDIVRQIKSLRG